MNDRKIIAPFDVSPKPGPLSLDGVFKQITTKPSAQLEEEGKVSGYYTVKFQYKSATKKFV